MLYRSRFYTDVENRIIPLRVASSDARCAALIARRERDYFAQEPAAASIDAVDAAYLRARIASPDSLFRDYAIAAHHEGRTSFALRRNGAAEAALAAVYRGEDLADVIAAAAARPIGNPRDQPIADRLVYHAGRILPGLVPINAAAGRLLDETLWRLEEMQGAPQMRAAAE